MYATLQINRWLANEWQGSNPILLEGEVGFELDSGKIKVGDGVTEWNNLDYIDSVINHDSLLNTHNLTTDINHNSLTNYVANEHIDWTDAEEDLLTTGIITASEVIEVSPELLDDPEFNSAGAWDTSEGGWTITGGKGIHTEAPTNMMEISPMIVEAGAVYKIVVDMASEYGGLNVTIGGVTKTIVCAIAIHTLYIRANDTTEFLLWGIGDVELNSVSVKKMYDGVFGNVLIGGILTVSEAGLTKLVVIGEDGALNVGGVGYDAPTVLDVIGGDGGQGDDTGKGSDINFTTGSSPSSAGTRGVGGDFKIITGDGRTAGVIDLNTGENEVTYYGTHGFILLNKSGGRIGLGGIVTPTALVHIAGGDTTRPPLQLGVGALSTTIRPGALEYCSITNRLFFSSNSTTRRAFVEGQGVNGRIPYWSGEANLGSDMGFIYNSVNQRVGAAGGFEVQDIKVVGERQTHIIDADGTLVDITTKFNNLLLKLETHGLLASS